MKIITNVEDLALGSVGVVAGYSLIYGGYAGKLIAKGLMPGVSFVLLNCDRTYSKAQIMLEDKIVTLSKPEIHALCIDTLVEDDFCC